MDNSVREIVRAPDGALHSWDGTTLSPRLDARQLGSLVFTQGYADRGTRIAQIPEAAAQFGIPPASETIAPELLVNNNPSRDPNDPYGYGTGPETSAISNPKQSYDPNGANYVAPTPQPTTPAPQQAVKQVGAQPTERSTSGGSVQAAAAPGSKLTVVSDTASAPTTSAYKFNSSAPSGWAIDATGHFVKVPDGYVRQGDYFVPSGSATPQPSTPTTPTPSTPTPSTPTAQQPVAIGPTLFAQLQAQGLTENDIVRNGTTISIKPTSRFYANVAGQQPSTPTPSTPNTPSAGMGGTTQQPTSPTQNGAPSTPVDPADKAWIDSYYQKYFDRAATSSELANWAKESPAALDQFLAADAKKYGYTSKYFQDTNNKSLEDALGIIDGSNLPPAIKDLWRTVVKGYPQGIEYNTDEILKTFQNIKDTTIDPHFRELTNIAMSDFQTQLGNLNTNREQELEAQRTTAGENIRQAKEGLEKSGLTFSGKAVEQLGDSSAFQQPGTDTPSALPPQTPFGGMFYEGKVNQANRLMATSASTRYNQALQGLGSAAEQKLGSAAAGGLGIPYNPVGGITGELATQQQAQYGSSLNQIIDNYNKKQTLNTNVSAT